MYIKRQRRAWLFLARMIRMGKVIAYPCEGVFGLGCHPRNQAAIQKILKCKRRPHNKGLIILSDDWHSASRFLSSKGKAMRAQAETHWPGAVTCLLDAHPAVSHWLRGQHRNIAVRVSDFEPLRVLCRAAGGTVVSTSANTARGRPWSPWGFRNKLGHGRSILGPTGGRDRPSRIVDLANGRIMR